MKITQSQLRQMIQEELELNRQLQSITRKQGKRASAIAITLKYLRTLLPLLPSETQSEVSKYLKSLQVAFKQLREPGKSSPGTASTPAARADAVKRAYRTAYRQKTINWFQSLAEDEQVQLFKEVGKSIDGLIAYWMELGKPAPDARK